MAVVRILYKSDHNHTTSSLDLIGVFTSKKHFEDATRKIIVKDMQENYEGQNPIENQIHWIYGFFIEKNQTQGLPSFELVCQIEKTNKIF